jgi:hypothetical protein
VISSCPSQGQSRSLAFYEFFQENYVLLPFLSICTIGGIALALQAAGSRAPGESRAWAEWGTLGLAVVAIGALLLWIPGLFLGLLLAKWVAKTRGLR